MIIITGATGQLGGAVTEHLLTRVPADQIGVSVRQPEKAAALGDRGVRVRRGDFDDPASLADAFDGATQVLIVSSNSSGDTALQQHQRAIEAAVAAGAERILYTAHLGAGSGSRFAPMVDHAATEVRLRDSGVAYTSLRNGFYAASGLMLMGRGVETGTVVAPQDGPVSWTTHADLAEVAAIALADPGVLDGPTPPLTAGDAHDLAGLAAIAAEVTGRPIHRVVVSDAEWTSSMVERGVPQARAELLLGVFVASRDGEFAAVDPTLASLLGRAPQSMRAVLEAAITR